MAEWLKAAPCYGVTGGNFCRGFESLPLRFLLYSGVAKNCLNRRDLLIKLEKVLPLIASDCDGLKKFVVRIDSSFKKRSERSCCEGILL